MQELVKPNAYPIEVREEVLAMSQTAREIANRWMLGWPKRVQRLIAENYYLEALAEQTRQEERAKMDTSLNHLSSWEKAQVWELSLAPPTSDYEEEAADEAGDEDE
jgi:hypothetical protein